MDVDLRRFVDRLCRFRSIAGEEAEAATWIRDRFDALGFETYSWDADAELLAGHPSFPSDPSAIDVTGRRSVAGVLALGDAEPTGGDGRPTVVLNGHIDVVPAEPESWKGDPFDPTWLDDDGSPTDIDDGTRLVARGAADMKSGLTACVGAALDVRNRFENGHEAAPNGDGDGDGDGEGDGDGDGDGGLRLVVEAVAGEEDGGYGAATAALANPYPFDRDAAIIAEPTDLRPVVACEGSLMARVELVGRSAHAATRWNGEDVLPRFERIRNAFADLETERGETITHPLYDAFPVPWPVVCGTVVAGSWASTVPASLEAEFRFGVAPGETVDDVEAQFAERLTAIASEDPWLREHPPTFERFSVQFEPCEIDPDEPIVRAVRHGLADAGFADASPEGATYGADARHYVEAGIPTVLFGPGDIAEAHYPDESIRWRDVENGRKAIAAAVYRFAAGYPSSESTPSGDTSSEVSGGSAAAEK